MQTRIAPAGSAHQRVDDVDSAKARASRTRETARRPLPDRIERSHGSPPRRDCSIVAACRKPLKSVIVGRDHGREHGPHLARLGVGPVIVLERDTVCSGFDGAASGGIRHQYANRLVSS